jgi:AcrR family transcriptional regulator
MAINEGRKAKKGDSRRRSEIAQAAARMFHDKGYDSTSIQDIADEVGLLKGSLYYYMNSKEDLLFELMERVHDGLMENWAQQDVEDGDSLAALRRFIRAHVIYTAEHLMQVRVFLHDFQALGETRRLSITGKRDEYEGILRRLLADAQAAGRVRADLSPKLASFAIFGTMNWVYQWYRPGGEWEAADIGDFIADFCVRALRCADEHHD